MAANQDMADIGNVMFNDPIVMLSTTHALIIRILAIDSVEGLVRMVREIRYSQKLNIKTVLYDADLFLNSSSTD